MSRRPTLTPAMVEALRNKGLNQTEIADAVGITRSGVSWIKRHGGGTFSRTPRELVNETWPLPRKSEWTRAETWRKLADHAEYQISGGEGMSKRKIQNIVWLYRKLRNQNLIIEFDPDIPPSRGARLGGFAYRPREERDGDLVLRENEHVLMTPESRDIWTIPDELPEGHKW